VDTDMRGRLLQEIMELRRKVFYGLNELGMCGATQALASMAFYFPLMKGILEDNYRHRLLHDRPHGYIDALLKEIGAEYDMFRAMSASSKYAGHVEAVTYESIRPIVEKFLREQFLLKLLEILKSVSERKLKHYNDYHPRFKASGDVYNLGIVENRIERHNRYLREVQSVVV